MKVYLEYYCPYCKEGMKMVLISGIIKCPKCSTVVYKKVKD